MQNIFDLNKSIIADAKPVGLYLELVDQFLIIDIY